MKQINKILIANRGEIAIRVMRTCQTMGIATVAIFSDADRHSLFVQHADEAVCIGGKHPVDSYLSVEKIIAAAHQTGSAAIHPGYGFLSENADFARRCQAEGIIFIGPNPDAISAMGSKIGAKRIMQARGVPTIPGYDGADQNPETLIQEALRIGFPLLLKASAGGGGKGMRVVYVETELPRAIDAAKREALTAFGDDTLLIEKYFSASRHVEFQIFGDQHGNVVHCFERECSVQRRHQKVLEESPSPLLTPELREQMGKAAVEAARAISYDNAGTVEFIVTADLNFYFLEVNTRLQVEHPVTEMVTGLDLVQMQIETAQGLPLSVSQNDLRQTGHAIEARLYAEDAANHFLPATGKVLLWREGKNSSVRYDSGLTTGSEIAIYYDPMIAKIIAAAPTRRAAIAKLSRALQDLALLGITSNRDFLVQVLQHPDFVAGEFDTQFLAQKITYKNPELNLQAQHLFAIAATLFTWRQRNEQRTLLKEMPSGWRNNFYKLQESVFALNETTQIECAYRQQNDGRFLINIENETYSVEHCVGGMNPDPARLSCIVDGHLRHFWVVGQADKLYLHHAELGNATLGIVSAFPDAEVEQVSGGYLSPMPGEVVRVLVDVGSVVQSGDALVVISSMKMENTIEAHSDGTVQALFVSEQSFVEAGALLVVIA